MSLITAWLGRARPYIRTSGGLLGLVNVGETAVSVRSTGKVGVLEKTSRVSRKKSPSSALPRDRKLQACGKLSSCRFSSV